MESDTQERSREHGRVLQDVLSRDGRMFWNVLGMQDLWSGAAGWKSTGHTSPHCPAGRDSGQRGWDSHSASDIQLTSAQPASRLT